MMGAGPSQAMSTAKNKYRQWCRTIPAMPVFSKDWWLDAACGEENWDVILVEERGEVVASFPYFLKRRSLFSVLSMPPLTQKLGPFIVYPDGSTDAARVSRDKRVMTEIIDRLPRHDRFQVHFDHSVTNWLPFYWRGFSQTTAYTYVIPDISDPNAVLARFENSKKGDIKKAARLVDVEFDLTAEAFYEHRKLALSKQGKAVSYPSETFQRIFEAAYAAASGKSIAARGRDGSLHAALFMVWSGEAAYYLITSVDPDYRQSGALSLLTLEAIRHASAYTKRFDFEGSMIEGVEASYRKFGTVQTPYMFITRTTSRLLRMREAALSAF